MGKNISVYLSDDLLNMVDASGEPASKIVQQALKKYFESGNREVASQQVVKSSRVIGKSDRLKEAIAEWNKDRELDRW